VHDKWQVIIRNQVTNQLLLSLWMKNYLYRIDEYRFTKRKDNRSAAIADLILKGLKYEALLQKKREKVSGL
jgi:metal-responsive CopG/Arc/MetJ family transcriptional regulator